jgi:hypothetical protein
MSKYRIRMVAAAAFALLVKGSKELLRTSSCRATSLGIVFAAILGLALRASADDHPVPIKGHLDEVLTSATPAQDGLHLTAAGEGTATHLGRLTSNENAVVHPDGTSQATAVWTAANGDQLFLSDMGSFTSPTTAAGTIIFTGGTGRFRNASGTAHFEAVIAPAGAHVSITFEGTIQY